MISVKRPEDIRRLMGRVIHELREGMMKPQIGNAIVYASNLTLQVMKLLWEQETIDEKILNLEKMFDELKNNKKSGDFNYPTIIDLPEKKLGKDLLD